METNWFAIDLAVGGIKRPPGGAKNSKSNKDYLKTFEFRVATGIAEFATSN
ncbi:hypothetical protein CSKR_201278 [Clonorchis sinensis]|uniref:Uncharacterized protein n=1 Tax=Clonorchis sinensis TaxID=79923 RepID=A0A8T1MPA7_CLOSI|nr:hypothetical protein CSKR_201278 [Clonorchis sinensis]